MELIDEHDPGCRYFGSAISACIYRDAIDASYVAGGIDLWCRLCCELNYK